MDDSLEKPTAELKRPVEDDVDDESQSSDEDEGPDWTKLMPSVARPVIPKRGEKEFEPSKHGGSGLQRHVLQRSRDAMFDALRATRTISNKAISYGIWHPDLQRVSVTVARGSGMNSIGHTVPRPTLTADGTLKTQKRLELLPEEAIYLIERGSLFCWKESSIEYPQDSPFENVSGSPMTVQQAYSEMVGKEDLTLDRYQVYAYLKRLGYVVTRSKPPNTYYPEAAPYPQPSTHSFLQRIFSTFPLWLCKISTLFTRAFNWWKPLRISCWLRREKNYGTIFRSLRFIPSGHKVPIHTRKESPASPYHPFFNLYKPPTPFKKSAPPPPDYQIVVVNARTTPMPSLRELTDLYAISPELPPPKPRVRNPSQMQGVSYKHPQAAAAAAAPQSPHPPVDTPSSSSQPASSIQDASPSNPTSISERLLSWLPFFKPGGEQGKAKQGQQRRLNPFMVLRAGKKTAIVAAVDAGNLNFFRFAQGAFEEGPWF